MKKLNYDQDGNVVCTTFEDNGKVISEVKDLSKQLVAETVFDGRPKARVVRMYLDGDNPGTFGPDRPCLRVELAADGKTVVAVSLLNDPSGAELNWKR